MNRHQTLRPAAPCAPALLARRQQRGVSLIFVLFILLLTIILVLAGLRLGIFNEALVGNQADAQRAQAAADALVGQAEREIRENGVLCEDAICRYPRNRDEYDTRFAALKNKCGTSTSDKTQAQGVCYPESPAHADFQIDKIDPDSTTFVMGRDSGADYVDFAKDAKTGTASLGLSRGQGKYWVEVYRYQGASSGSGSLASAIAQAGASAPASTEHLPAIPEPGFPYIYRITAYAKGIKGSVSMVRAYYVPVPRKPL